MNIPNLVLVEDTTQGTGPTSTNRGIVNGLAFFQKSYHYGTIYGNCYIDEDTTIEGEVTGLIIKQKTIMKRDNKKITSR